MSDPPVSWRHEKETSESSFPAVMVTEEIPTYAYILTVIELKFEIKIVIEIAKHYN
jgi:hypothetical protein